MPSLKVLLELRRGDLQRDRLVHEVPDVAGSPGEVLEADLAHALIGQAVCPDGTEPGITKEVAKLLQLPGPHYLVHVGDLVPEGDEVSQEAFQPPGPEMSAIGF